MQSRSRPPRDRFRQAAPAAAALIRAPVQAAFLTALAALLLAGVALAQPAPATSGGDAAIRAQGSSNPRALSRRFSDTLRLADYEPAGTPDLSVCNGVHDETPALTAIYEAAIHSPRSGTVIQLPGGNCVAGALHWSNPGSNNILLAGAGRTGTMLTFREAAGIDAVIGGAGGLSLRDLSMQYRGSATGGVGLRIAYTSQRRDPGATVLQNFTASGNWATAVELVSAVDPDIDDAQFVTLAGTGLYITGTGPLSPGVSKASPILFAIDAKISNAVFQNGAYGLRIDGYTQGVFVTNSEALGAAHCLYWGYPGAAYPAAMTPELLMLANWHGNCHFDDVYVQAAAPVSISGGLMFRYAPNPHDAWNAIDLEAVGQGSIAGVSGNGAGQGAETLVKIASASSSISVIGNNAVFLAGYGLTIDASSSHITAEGNIWSGVSAGGILDRSSRPASNTLRANTINGASVDTSRVLALNGVFLGSTIGTSVGDLSHGVSLYGASNGFNITPGRLNIVSDRGSAVWMNIGGQDVFHASATGINATQIGAQDPAYGGFSAVRASGPISPGATRKASLPRGCTAGQMLYVTDARNHGEAPGAGTGALAICNRNAAWLVAGAAVQN